MKSVNLIVILMLALILTACGSNATPTPIPTLVFDSEDSTNTDRPVPIKGEIVASGVVVPAQEANMAFGSGGNVEKVNVKVGDKVKDGQVLVELDNTLARLELERAQRALRELTSPAAIAAAEEALATAQKDMEDAEKKVVGLNYARASDVYLDNLEGEIDLAEKQLAVASDAYRLVARRPDGDPKKATALVAMTNAQLNLNKLQSTYEWLTGKPSETDAAITQAKYDAAKAAHQEAQWYLAALKGEQVPADASGMKLAQLQQAQSDVIAAQAQLDQSILQAPFSGIVSEVDVVPGDYAAPGRILLVVSDLNNLQVETTDLSELDISKVKIGNPASILIDALNQEFAGKVITISPVAQTLGGDVVYKVTLAFDELPEGALGGMTAEVNIGE